MGSSSLLQRYRRDRQKLLAFLLSSGLIRELRTPAGPITNLSAVDLDSLSASYVLECIKSGGVIDISTAAKMKLHESSYPIIRQSRFQTSYFLHSHPDFSGAPPSRAPPPIMVERSCSSDMSCSSRSLESSFDDNIASSSDDCGPRSNETTVTPSKLGKDLEVPALGLPKLYTGLADDDLNETAYIVLLASMAFSRIEIYSFEDKKKENVIKHSAGMKSTRDEVDVQSENFERHLNLLHAVHNQMQISAIADACMRKRLMELAARRNWGQINVPQILLALLHGVFRSDFPSEKSYIQWKLRQVNILEEFCFSANLVASERRICESSLMKIRSTKEWDINMVPSERAKILSGIARVLSKLSAVAAYHFNIRLYEKLLFGILGAINDNHPIMEVDDSLVLVKLTWPVLGITSEVHSVIHGWVLFQQKIASSKNDDGKEEQYLQSPSCSITCNGNEMKLSLAEAVFFLISSWCDIKLQAYHLHFLKKPSYFGKVVSVLSTVGVITSYDGDTVKLTRLDGLKASGARKLRTYVERSIEAAYKAVENSVNSESKETTHPLALLANRLRLVAEKEITVFFPVLRQLCPDSGIIAAMLLHQFYGEKLKPFLKEVSNLSDDVRSVLPAAYSLDRDLTHLFTSASKESRLSPLLKEDLEHYPIVQIAKPIILDWMIDQLEQTSEWTGRAFKLEDWEPISFQQNLAASVIEVFRIIEETVDQFFDLNLPMDITHLQALLSIVYHSLDGYLSGLLNQLVEKNCLYPPVPPLTRFVETTTTGKKKLPECHLDEHVTRKLNGLTISKLCIKLNTLGYIQKHIGTLEDGIGKSWALLGGSTKHKQARVEVSTTANGGIGTCSDEANELFATTFNNIKSFIAKSISKFCDFTGIRVIFSDLKDEFLSYLYRGNVEAARLEGFLMHLDVVLNNVCGMIDDTLRDLVVLSICRASMEAFTWVMLSGGPSRAFSDSDIVLIKEDLGILKDFFVADGEGLPRTLVEKEAKFAEEILGLYSLPTETIIQLLISSSGKISTELDPCSNNGSLQFNDSQTLVRVLCHKKDTEASMFLKRKYNLPASSDYDDTPPLKDSTPT
ncbi:protein unc-13 homolog isoform X2 [Benincasa hispida]|uniref:protein unc-13 homolog isoform X2 n=1 Tax=Benincasa hispida TaxID=102211 RepID=UPI00190096D0|nr:protein unc-13 homolog isoform X2 [Benincasa hispida]